jgi:hypothetical protein
MATVGAVQNTVDLGTRDGLCRLEGWVDNAPILTSRANMADPLTDWWRDVVRKLIAIAKRTTEVSSAQIQTRLDDGLNLDGWDGEWCRSCGDPYSVVWWAEGDLWEALTGRTDGGGTLCPSCFARLADEAGVTIEWRVRRLV